MAPAEVGAVEVACQDTPQARSFDGDQVVNAVMPQPAEDVRAIRQIRSPDRPSGVPRSVLGPVP